MSRIVFPSASGSDYVGAEDAITRERIGPGQVLVVCDDCQGVVRMATYRMHVGPHRANGVRPVCVACGSVATRREFVPPTAPDVKVRLEYVSLVANVTHHVCEGIDAPGRGAETDDRPWHDPIPGKRWGDDEYLPNGTQVQEHVVAYFNARNARMYGYHRRLQSRPLEHVARWATCIVRLAPWVTTLAGTWVADGALSARATRILATKDALRSLDYTTIHGRWWRDTRPGAPFGVDDARRRQMQAGLLVPDWVPPEAFTAIVVADHGTARHVREALAAKRSPVLAPPVTVDPDRFFDGHCAYLSRCA
ncbi:MAG: DUF4433 domain-containing protein [Chloroflexi bacterium]|jgi:hypothetical protein|nr:DUF4433 domain-containing protein [Chloroflexota bacterium]